MKRPFPAPRREGDWLSPYQDLPPYQGMRLPSQAIKLPLSSGPR